MSTQPLNIKGRAQGKLGVDNIQLPPLPAVRAFEAAARLGSFAKAAAELDTSAASVSYHVRRLEQHTGVGLFLRHAQGVELTSAGELVAAQALEAFAILRAAFVSAMEADETRLALTALPSFGTAWLAPRLGRFSTKHPGVTLELELSATPHDLTEGRFDAAFRHGHGRWPGLHAIPLFPSIFMPLCAPALKEAAQRLADPQARPALPLLGRHDWWTRWYQALGVGQPPAPGALATRLSAEHLDVAAAIAGHGIAMASPILFHAEMAAGRLVPAHDFVAGDGKSFWLAYPAAKHNRPKMTHFREWLRDELASELPAVRGYIRKAVGAGPL